MLSGLIDLPWWGYVVYALVVTHITIAAVTIFLHRAQAHRGLDLHPVVSHFFRFWLWLTTGMVTREWVAIHRKHHARCETPEDPHSPQIFGIRKLLLEGSELYRAEAKNRETLEKFGSGTPDDWIERNLYSRHSVMGPYTTLALNALLFGPIGITIFAVQMLWIPVTAAGIINGVGHFWGYRNFAAEDASRNILPWGIIIGGEELHNNHHAYPSSARLSSKWYEFDIGWMYIRMLEMVGLARVKKVAAQVKLDMTKTVADVDTLDAVIAHRYDVLSRYGKMLAATWRQEIGKMKQFTPSAPNLDLSALRQWLQRDAAEVPETVRPALSEVLSRSEALQKTYAMRQELSALWARSTASKEQLVQQLQDWCARAEQSGVTQLRDFSLRLRSYA
ncbi:MAG: acyl-CoA desaturase [bacterium]|jgi:stearoyl-CoA desaturase (delta-9 desaturase)|nr:fatty acid desaturase [Betaproteobacteria bacterium]